MLPVEGTCWSRPPTLSSSRTNSRLLRLLQFYIVKENRGNEGTCVGVSRWPVHDFNHRTTSDMWLYRAYSGNLYHNGEQTLTLSSFTQGDFITCVLDMEARTVSFSKNGEVRHFDQSP